MSMSTTDRRIAGVGLIGFSALLLVEDRLDPTSGVKLYEAATTHPGLLTASALSLLGSAVLTVPAIAGIVCLRPGPRRGPGPGGRFLRPARSARAHRARHGVPDDAVAGRR